jgi:hypothetical protein
MKTKMHLFIYFDKWPTADEGTYEAFCFKTEDTSFRTFVCEQDVEIEVPDNYDPTQQQIASLQSQHDLAFKKFTELAAEIKNQISKLQALEYTA